MKWPSWLSLSRRREAAASDSLTACPDCGREMTLVEKTTFSGNDMRTYSCERCGKEHIVDYGVAVWKALSDARNSDKGSC
jgi:DNA-directed RNA polymerase subunit RPC12/RpoP